MVTGRPITHGLSSVKVFFNNRASRVFGIYAGCTRGIRRVRFYFDMNLMDRTNGEKSRKIPVKSSFFVALQPEPRGHRVESSTRNLMPT